MSEDMLDVGGYFRKKKGGSRKSRWVEGYQRKPSVRQVSTITWYMCPYCCQDYQRLKDMIKMGKVRQDDGRILMEYKCGNGCNGISTREELKRSVRM